MAIEDPSIFEILGVETTEIRHSNMLAFLLSYEQNGAIGKEGMKTFISELQRTHGKELEGLLPTDIDHAIWRVDRENENIDLAIVFCQQKKAILIENKTLSDVHNSKEEDTKDLVSQLKKYTDEAENLWKGYSFVRVLLKPFVDETADYDDQDTYEKPWHQLNYSAVKYIVEKVK